MAQEWVGWDQLSVDPSFLRNFFRYLPSLSDRLVLAQVQIDRQIDRYIDRQIYRYIDIQIDKQTYRKIDRKTDIQTERQTDRQTDSQIVRQIDVYIFLVKYTWALLSMVGVLF